MIEIEVLQDFLYVQPIFGWKITKIEQVSDEIVTKTLLFRKNPIQEIRSAASAIADARKHLASKDKAWLGKTQSNL